MINENSIQWTCWKCENPLGERPDQRLRIASKRARYVIDGEVLAICRRCGEPNQYPTETDSPQQPTVRDDQC